MMRNTNEQLNNAADDYGTEHCSVKVVANTGLSRLVHLHATLLENIVLAEPNTLSRTDVKSNLNLIVRFAQLKVAERQQRHAERESQAHIAAWRNANQLLLPRVSTGSATFTARGSIMATSSAVVFRRPNLSL
jgi:hypothetical protein